VIYLRIDDITKELQALFIIIQYFAVTKPRSYTDRNSHILHVTQSTINKDLAYLRKQALENLQHHIHEKIPEEYQRCMIGMKLNLKETLEIAESTSDPR
jgi:DeoR/GlpR family transcriptional regulator of sugar metabolism